MRYTLALLVGLLLVIGFKGSALAATPTPAPPPPPRCYCDGSRPVCSYCGTSGTPGVTTCCDTLFPTQPDEQEPRPPRPSTAEERQQLWADVTAQLGDMPPGLERDREYARLLGEYGFLEDQVQVLRNVTDVAGVTEVEEAIQIMNLYARIGQPDVAVQFGAEVSTELPVFVIPGVEPTYLDFNAGNRVAILQSAAALAAAGGLADEAETLVQEADSLQTQIEQFNILDVIGNVLGVAQ